MLSAGKFSSIIEVQASTGAQDKFGGVLDEYATVATVRANVQDMAGAEVYAAASERSETTTEFRFRVCEVPQVTTAHRILFDGAAYDIEGAWMVERRRVWLVRAIRRVA